MVDGAVGRRREERAWSVHVATEKDPRERHVYRVQPRRDGLRPADDGGRDARSRPLPRRPLVRLELLERHETPPSTVPPEAPTAPSRRSSTSRRTCSADYALPTIELGSFHGADGTLFYTSLDEASGLRPREEVPGRRLRLRRTARAGGPGTRGRVPRLDTVLAAKGILVWTMDNRGSWGRGHAFETPVLKNLGTLELEDQLEGIAELKKRPYVDGSRIGIRGWSYGGYLTLFAATHAGEVFRCAVAGAPVTDWKFYDSIYTERYMKLPKDNVEGYKASSPVQAAGKLGTRLLILHGTSDDNVHMQNTMVFADALMKARKDYDFVPLPRQPHGPRDPAARLYAYQRIAEFFEETLLK